MLIKYSMFHLTNPYYYYYVLKLSEKNSVNFGYELIPKLHKYKKNYIVCKVA